MLKDQPSNAESLLEVVHRHMAKRAELMPDQKTAIRMMFDAYQRLRELGWDSATYCPKDGSVFEVIEVGSTGVHQCVYRGEWPHGHFWVLADNGYWPAAPILYRKLSKDH